MMVMMSLAFIINLRLVSPRIATFAVVPLHVARDRRADILGRVRALSRSPQGIDRTAHASGGWCLDSRPVHPRVERAFNSSAETFSSHALFFSEKRRPSP